MTVPEDANIHQLSLLPPHWPDMEEVAQRLPRWDLHEIFPGQVGARSSWSLENIASLIPPTPRYGKTQAVIQR
jgi:hypothetical protein